MEIAPTKPTGTPAARQAQAAFVAQLRSASIALLDILFELGEFKTRRDHDLHEQKGIVRRQEAEIDRLADVMHLLRDLQATFIHLTPPATPDPPVCVEAARDERMLGELDAAQFLNGGGI